MKKDKMKNDKMKRTILIFVSGFVRLMAFIAIAPLYGQSHSASLTNGDMARTQIICRELQGNLARAGFENVLCAPQNAGSIIIAYENRRYRYDITALGMVLQTASRYFSEINRLVLIIKRDDVSVIALQMAPVDLEAYVTSQITAREFEKRIRFLAINEAERMMGDAAVAASNSSFRKVDLTLQPMLNMQLGNREDPYKFKVDLLPTVSTVLARGLTTEFSLSIPLADEISFKKNESLRLYSLTLSHFLSLGRQTYLANHLGYFSGERYGLVSQAAHYFLNGNLAFHSRVDYTGFLYYADRAWFYSRLNLWTYQLGAQWRFSAYDLRASVQYGKYLFGDRGARLALGRQLGEAWLDFFAIETGDDRWIGFELGLPLFPNRRLRPQRFRLNLPEHYRFKYDYVTSDLGQQFRLAHDLAEFRGTLTANYICNHLYELRQCFLTGERVRITKTNNKSIEQP